MILKRRTNPCSEKAHLLRKPKSSNEHIKIQNNDYCFFFDIHEIVYLHWALEVETINRHYHLHVLAELCEGIRKKTTELWKDKSWVLHQDNVSVKSFLAKYSVPVLDHSRLVRRILATYICFLRQTLY